MMVVMGVDGGKTLRFENLAELELLPEPATFTRAG
jgi:hypothetical protein